MSQTASESSQDQHQSDDLKQIASYQKVILICILFYLGGVVGQFLIPLEMRMALALVVLVVMLVATVFVFLLATKLYGAVVGILLGILTLIPLIGLLVLLSVNGKATQTLKDNGISVGLLGAKGPIS